MANENKYHPIRDYLNTLVWDGTERIRFCLRHFLGADADDYTYEALKLFLLGAISRAFQPGCKFEIMLCLVGGQGAGKSTFFRLLAVRDEWFSMGGSAAVERSPHPHRQNPGFAGKRCTIQLFAGKRHPVYAAAS